MDALEGLVTEVDAEGPATPEQQAEQAKAATEETQAREWGMLAFTVGAALSMLAPELKQIYTEEACERWGLSVVPVAEKYGWNGPGNVPEIGLAICTLGLAVPTVLVVRMKLAQIEAARRQSRPPPAAEAAPPPAGPDTTGATNGG